MSLSLKLESGLDKGVDQVVDAVLARKWHFKIWYGEEDCLLSMSCLGINDPSISAERMLAKFPEHQVGDYQEMASTTLVTGSVHDKKDQCPREQQELKKINARFYS